MADSIQISKVGMWHEQLALFYIANPEATLSDAAKHFGKTAAWICIIKNSDAFRTYWAQRMDQAFGETVGDIYGKTAAMTELALDRLNEKLEIIGHTLPIDQLESIADTGLKRLGYGLQQRHNVNPTNVQVNVGVTVDRGDLERARQRMVEKAGVTSTINQMAVPEIAAIPPEHEVREEASSQSQYPAEGRGSLDQQASSAHEVRNQQASHSDDLAIEVIPPMRSLRDG